MRNIFLLVMLALSGCVSVPEGVQPVKNFSLTPYLGKWYEVARLDHSFERGLSQVSAEYSLRPDGGVRVLNRGFDATKNKWKEAEGKAYFVQDSQTAFLKVSFFGPFYGSYIVMDVDPAQYSLISGPNKSYLWILSRTPTLDKTIYERLVAKAKALGFETDKLIVLQ